jgi:hypothetical protein
VWSRQEHQQQRQQQQQEQRRTFQQGSSSLLHAAPAPAAAAAAAEPAAAAAPATPQQQQQQETQSQSQQPQQQPAQQQAQASGAFGLVREEIECVTERLRRDIFTEIPALERAAEYFFRAGAEGKRLRSTMLLLVASALAPTPPGLQHLTVDTAPPSEHPPEARRRQQRIAEITELIHVASLLHDDVIDSAGTRRGKKSLNALFGNKVRSWGLGAGGRGCRGQGQRREVGSAGWVAGFGQHRGQRASMLNKWHQLPLPASTPAGAACATPHVSFPCPALHPLPTPHRWPSLLATSCWPAPLSPWPPCATVRPSCS